MRNLWTTAAVCGIAATMAIGAGCKGQVGIGDTEDGTDPFVENNDPANNVAPNNDPANNNVVDPAETFECVEGQTPEEVPLRRLSMAQYRYTLTDLLDTVASADAADIWTSVAPILDRLPDDRPTRDGNSQHGGYRRIDQAVQQQHVEASLDAAVRVGDLLTATPAQLGELMGDCATDADPGNDAQCLDDFITSFGRLTHRRPLDSADVDFYRSVHDAQSIDPVGVRDVIAVMLTSPHFLYHVEHGADPVTGKADVVGLDPFEVAARLSYHFWQSMPDEELFSLAADGTLLDDAVYATQVDRVFADPKTSRSIETFMQEWLWLDELPEMNGLVGTTLYDNFAGDNAPSADLREAMIEEVQELGRYYTLTAPGSFDDLFTSPYSFARSDELAAIYGVSAWGSGEPPTFNEDEREGLFARAAFLATGTANTRPIMKGLFIREGLLCTVPPPPPDNAAMIEINLQDGMTTREVVEELTEQSGTTCAGCHLNYLNPLGFVTENFDALGRYRTHQTMFDDDGNVTGEREVDTAASPQVPIGTPHDVASATELTPHLVASGQLYSCFARNYVQFTFSRVEDETTDGCVLEATRELLAEGASLPDVLKGLALTAEFKERTMVE